MNQDQQTKIASLRKCTFQVASYDKRFVGDIASMAPETELTSKQANLLEQMYHRYRKQIGEKAHKATCRICSEELPRSVRVTRKSTSEELKLERWTESVKKANDQESLL